mgnify:CR=1 FL=1
MFTSTPFVVDPILLFFFTVRVACCSFEIVRCIVIIIWIRDVGTSTGRVSQFSSLKGWTHSWQNYLHLRGRSYSNYLKGQGFTLQTRPGPTRPGLSQPT